MNQSTHGVDPGWIAGNDFIQLHLDLVDALDGDFHAALLLDRIKFRAGTEWWTATREEMQAATRLSEWQLRKAANKLRDLGFIESERISAYNPIMRWRVIIAETTVNEESSITTMSDPQSPAEESSTTRESDSPSLPLSKNSKELHTRTSENIRRDDVERLCEFLADKIEQNGSRRPTITKAWRDAARLMLDKDAIPFDMVKGAIQWSQNHEFWRSNILSMPKLREKYDQLRLQAERGNGNRSESRMQEHLAHIRDLWENNPVDNPQKQLEG